MRFFSLLFLATLILQGCEGRDDKPARIIDFPESMPAERGERAVILISDSGWTKVRLEVGAAERYVESFESLLRDGVLARFYDREGGVNALLTADSARIDDQTGDMCAYGAVRVHSERNRTLVLTDMLCYTKEESKLHSDRNVQVHDTLRGRFIRGTGFESDDALKWYTFYNVTGEATSLPN